MAARDAVLLIHTGDLPGLTAAMIRPEPGQLVIWHPQRADAAAPQRRAAVESLAGALDAREIVFPRISGPGETDVILQDAIELLHAIADARVFEAGRIIWARQVGPDAAGVAETVDRAETAAHLARIGGHHAPDIELPIVDLRDEQVVDLADDVGAPMTCFWPCSGGAKLPCGQCEGCGRWQLAFEQAGTPWPWSEACQVRAPG